MGFLCFEPVYMTCDKSTMRGKVMNVHGNDGKMTRYERWLGDIDTLHLPRSLVVQLDSKATTLI